MVELFLSRTNPTEFNYQKKSIETFFKIKSYRLVQCEGEYPSEKNVYLSTVYSYVL